MTNEITDQYAAAWIEARGQVQTNVGGVGRSRPQVRVAALDPAVPDALAKYFGLGKTDTFNPRTAPHLTLYVWQAVRVAGAREGGSGGARADRPLHGEPSRSTLAV